ncbi:MAG: hypothetical protein QOH71_2717 [Blastocatellia bacterium]|nr:hypothetical protein [Blastocatellia bacterium]
MSLKARRPEPVANVGMGQGITQEACVAGGRILAQGKRSGTKWSVAQPWVPGV